MPSVVNIPLQSTMEGGEGTPTMKNEEQRKQNTNTRFQTNLVSSFMLKGKSAVICSGSKQIHHITDVSNSEWPHMRQIQHL